MTTFEGTRVTYIYVWWKYFTSRDSSGKKLSIDKWGVVSDYKYFDAIPDSDILYKGNIKRSKGYKQAVRFLNSLTNRFKHDNSFYAKLEITMPLTHSGAVFHATRWQRKKMQHNLYKSHLTYVKHEITKREFEDDNKFVNRVKYKPNKQARRRKNRRNNHTLR